MARSNRLKWDFNNEFEELMNHFLLAITGRRKYLAYKEAVLPLALLIFLRQQNAFLIKNTADIDETKEYVIIRIKNRFTKQEVDVSVCCDNTVIERIQNEDFKGLLLKSIEKIRNVNDSKDFMLSFLGALLNQEFKEGELLSLFDRAMREVFRINEEATQPHELSLLVSHLVDKKAEKIYDPFGGFMDFATTMPDKHFVASEINEFTRDIALFRLALAGIIDHSESYFIGAEDWMPGKFDAIVTFPPFACKLDMEGDFLIGPSHQTDVDLAVLERFEKTTNEQGQLVMVVPLSTLFRENSGMKNLRRTLTEKNLLDTVIILPSNILQTTKIPTAIIVLKKGKRKNDKVRFIDASDCFFKKEVNILDVETIIHRYNECDFFVSKETIIECDSLWDFRWYLEQKKIVFKDGYDVVELSKVISPIIGNRKFEEKRGHVANISSLSSDCFFYEKNIEDFPEKDDLKQTIRIAEPALLLSMINHSKPTFCNASEQSPIFIKSDVCAYKVINKTVHVGYLSMELAKRLRPTKGLVIPRMSKTQILRALIEFPSLDGDRSYTEQKNIFEESKQTALIGKAKELGLEELLEQKKKEYVEEIRHRKHDMKTPMGQLRNTLTLLESLVPQISGEPSEKLMLYVNRQKKALDTLSEIVTHIADEDNFAKPEPINLGEVLSSFKTKTNRYIIDYYIDNTAFSESGIEKPIVMMGKSDLLRLVQNIVENAIKRGFTGDYPEYALNISLTIKDGFYFIDFSNNGEPLPEGLTKERYGMKGEKGKGSDGSGTGGYIVKSITEHYGGDYDIFTHHFAEQYFTHVIVKLPIYQVEDE